MPPLTQDAFLTIILVAILANLVVAFGLLIGPRLRGRRTAERDETAEINRRVLLRAQALAGGGWSGAESIESSGEGYGDGNGGGSRGPNGSAARYRGDEIGSDWAESVAGAADGSSFGDSSGSGEYGADDADEADAAESATFDADGADEAEGTDDVGGASSSASAEVNAPVELLRVGDRPTLLGPASDSEDAEGDAESHDSVSDAGERGDGPEASGSGSGDGGGAAEGDRGEAASTDLVTGFDGPATWSKRVTEENARVQRYGRAATIALIELAGFERLAERIGQAAADRLIPPIAITMRKHARSADSLARLGPTRFAVLLPDTDEVKAINYVERVRSACDVWLEAGAVSLRLCIGWAEISANQLVDPAIQTAERRLNEERQRLRSRDRGVDDRDVVAAQMRPAPAN